MGEAKAFLVFSGGNDRAVLAFLRALSLCGEHACIVARTRADRILRTHFRQDVVHVRKTAELTLAIFLDCIQQVRKAIGSRVLVILPSSEYFNNFLLQHREKIRQLGCEIPLVDKEIYSLLTNKRSAADFFAASGVTIPAEFSALDGAKLPLVAKPIHNVNVQGASLYPLLLHTKEDVFRFKSMYSDMDFFFQEYMHGQSLYFFVHISRDSRHVLTYSQRNMLQQPQGKSMLLAEPCEFHNLPAAQRLLEVLDGAKFTGLGMIELIQEGDRIAFIEMNPRIWGPIQFCLDQDQPLLQAFIGEWLHGDPERYLTCLSQHQRSHYSWLGGLLDTLVSRDRPTWHVNRVTWVKLITICVRNDVYLRIDSWRCFLLEIGQSILKAFHDNRNQR